MPKKSGPWGGLVWKKYPVSTVLASKHRKGSQDFFHTFSIALCCKWDVKNDFAYVLKFFSLISDGLGSVNVD